VEEPGWPPAEADLRWRDEEQAREALASIATVEILIVEDEAAIVDFLERGLTSEGFEVTTVGDGDAAERLAIDRPFDLVVLDWMLPGRDGLELLAAIRRAKPALPVVMLTAKGEVADRVAGLESGATDYVTKPFAFAELLARIRARLRETEAGAETALAGGDIRLDLLTRVASRGGTEVKLPEREADLLAHLIRNAGRVCSRQELLAAVWGLDHDPGTNVVQVYVGYLRRKLARPGAPDPIETVRGAGYRLRGAR
jgi:DNA-binding response OmpR family regulator